MEVRLIRVTAQRSTQITYQIINRIKNKLIKKKSPKLLPSDYILYVEPDVSPIFLQRCSN